MAESRAYRHRFYVGNFVFLAIFLAILVCVFWLRDLLSGGRIDFTEDKVYTISPATKTILEGLIDKIQVDYYVSNELPSSLQTLKRDTRDMFEEFKELGGGHFQYSIIDPEDKAKREAEEKVRAYYEAKERGETPEEPEPVQTVEMIFSRREPPKPEELRKQREELAEKIAQKEKRSKDDIVRELLEEEFRQNAIKKLAQEGIESFGSTESEAGSVRQLRIYSTIQIRYLDKQPEVIPTHYRMEALELELASRILKLSQDEKNVILFFDARKPAAPPFEPGRPPQMPPSDYQAVVQYLGEFFDVREIDLKENDSIEDAIKRIKKDRERKRREDAGEEEPEKEPEVTVAPEDYRLVKTLIVAQPDALAPRQVYEINRAASLGVATIILASRFTMDISREGVQRGIPLGVLAPGSEFEDMLREWGVDLLRDVLASNQAGTVQVQARIAGLPVMTAQMLSAAVRCRSAEMSSDSALTNRIPAVTFPAAVGLKTLAETLKKNGLVEERLAWTPEHTWSVEIDPYKRLQNPMFRDRGIGSSIGEEMEQFNLKNPEEYQGFLESPVTLAVLLRGKVPFSFEGESIPAWPKEPEKEKDEEADDASGDLLLNAVDPQDVEEAKAEGPAEEAAPQSPAAQQAPTPPAGTPAAETPAAAPAAGAPPVAPEAPGAAPQAETRAAAPAAGGEAAKAPPPAEAAEKAHLEPVEGGKVLLVSSADVLKNDYVVNSEYGINVRFFENAVETFGLGDLLLQIRQKQVTLRQFEPGSEKSYLWIIALNVAVVPLLAGLFGLVYFLARRAQSISYERRHLGA
jgi:ABC-type uncharacterized transport system involved in gliding motility auxiliary subunit